MADTRQTRDAFLNSSTGLFKDNTAGDISPQDLRDFVLSCWGTDYLDSAETGDFTGVVGYLHPVDLSGASSDFEVTFPGSPVAGDVFGFFISVPHAANTYCVQPQYSAATKVNGVDYSATKGKWSLWQRGEYLSFKYVDSTVGWQVINDGRIPFACRVHVGSDVGSGTGWTQLVLNTEDSDVGSFFDTSAYTCTIKRAGQYLMGITTLALNAINAKYYGARICNTASPVDVVDCIDLTWTSNSGTHRACTSTSKQLASGRVLQGQWIAEDNGSGLDAAAGGNVDTHMYVQEIL
jgi:hypothetical protein